MICSTRFPHFDIHFEKKFKKPSNWRATCAIIYWLHVTLADKDSSILSRIVRSGYFLPHHSTCTYNLPHYIKRWNNSKQLKISHLSLTVSAHVLTHMPIMQTRRDVIYFSLSSGINIFYINDPTATKSRIQESSHCGLNDVWFRVVLFSFFCNWSHCA